MPLYCDETGDHLPFGQALYAIYNGFQNSYTIIGVEALARIPESSRRNEPFRPKERGINVYFANSTETSDGEYSLKDIEIGNFCFSISERNIQLFFPEYYRWYKNGAFQPIFVKKIS